MFGRAFFGRPFFGERYFGNGGAAVAPGGVYFGRHYFGGSGGGSPPVGISAADVWNYVLSNGKTAEQNLVENNAMLIGLVASSGWGALLEGPYTASDLLKVIAAVAAGLTRIVALQNGRAHLEFDAVDHSHTAVIAEMQGSERIAVTLDP